MNKPGPTQQELDYLESNKNPDMNITEASQRIRDLEEVVKELTTKVYIQQDHIKKISEILEKLANRL